MMPTGAAEDDSAPEDRITDRYHAYRHPSRGAAAPAAPTRIGTSYSRRRNVIVTTAGGSIAVHRAVVPQPQTLAAVGVGLATERIWLFSRPQT